MFFPKFDWPRVLNPKLRFPVEGENLRNVENMERTSLEQIDTAIQKYRNDIACMIIEPIQGEGGDNHFRPQFMQTLRKLCDQNEMMFILDEIQAGMGLTGKMWAHEHYNIKPDMICFGKKIQTAGFMCNSRIDEIDENCLTTPTRLNSTWGGNLVDFVRATRYLEIMEEEHLLKNAEVQGKLLLEGFAELAEKYPKMVSNVRGRGLMCAFDTPSAEVQGKLREEAYKRDMLILACGPQSIRLRPPLTVLEEDIKNGMSILDKCVKTLK
jgi:L-lysine 6-transaminase